MKIGYVIFVSLFLFFVSSALAAETEIDFNGAIFNIGQTTESNWNYSYSVPSSSAIMKIKTSEKAVCRYSSSKSGGFDSLENSFDYNFETLHKKVLTGLVDGVYRYYAKCRNESNYESAWLTLSFSVNVPVTAQIVLSENSPVRTNQIKVKLITSKVVSQTPSLSYSFDGLSYTPLPLEGSGYSWQGDLIIPQDLEESSASFKFSARDLEGIIGTEIVSGDVFLVDRKSPEPVSEFSAVGSKDRIKLSWTFDEGKDNIKEYRIYRFDSEGVDSTDFYDKTENQDFVDSDVDSGKRYYYRVSVVDQAGNEGRLSQEVSAIALLTNLSSSSENTLSPELAGKIDNFLLDVNVLSEQIKSARDSLSSKEGNVKFVYDSLRIDRDIVSANAELDSLKSESSRLKGQKMSAVELDSKLSAYRVKLGSIKKKVAENIIISSELNGLNDYSENSIYKMLLELNPSKTSSENEKWAKKLFEQAKEIGFKSTSNGINSEIIYLDGSVRKLSVIKHSFEGLGEYNQSLSIYLDIPEEIANSFTELNVLTEGYNLEKEDLIFSVDSNTREVIYSVVKNFDLDAIKKVGIFLISEDSEKVSDSNSITGYFSFVQGYPSSNRIFFVLAGLLIIGLTGYLFYLKKSEFSEKIVLIKAKIVVANKLIEKNELNSAKKLYKEISKDYLSLNQNEKIGVYLLLDNLYKRLGQG